MTTLDKVLQMAKEKYLDEIEKRRIEQMREGRKNTLVGYIQDYYLVNRSKIDSFNVILPTLFHELRKNGTLIIHDSKPNYSAGYHDTRFMTLDFNIPDDISKITFSFQLAVPKTSVGSHDPYKRQYKEMGELDFNATKEEVIELYGNALAESLKLYFDL